MNISNSRSLTSLSNLSNGLASPPPRQHLGTSGSSRNIKLLADTLDKVERSLELSEGRIDKARQVASRTSYEDVSFMPGEEARHSKSGNDGRLGKFGSRSVNDIAHLANKSPRTSPFGSSYGIERLGRGSTTSQKSPRTSVGSLTAIDPSKSKKDTIQDVTSRLTDPNNFPSATRSRLEQAAKEKTYNSNGSLNSLSGKTSAKADEVVKRLTDPKNFTGVARSQADDKKDGEGYVNGYVHPSTNDKEKMRTQGKISFFNGNNPPMASEPAAERALPVAPAAATNSPQAGIATWL
ncbi:hypothetical protein SmJEL517_g00403 [Synchytrium microbalum]|uniref:Uncharacterized protein n=1 Tax=Synchytrium microbalum TaxID=1806994 RepID=A0A507CF39_9FUNG|nr:uncharacterized protein SmJEL517_g00403 [Synchytrium microbalum]TPX37978.1 hypothetical protein SmJEL517_g00403 [Synchytrium microbalum]